MENNFSFTFFGTSKFSVLVLDELKRNNFVPKLIITSEDKPKGRKLILAPSETKKWALENGVDYIQPRTLRSPEVLEEIKKYSNFDLFIVASYGKIIPQNILDIPIHQTLNVHPSLLPKLRGPSPIQSAILSENETGVTIMRLDAEMDHGPIVAQQKIEHIDWPPYEKDLEEILGRMGGTLLAKIIPDWLSGTATEKEQNHSLATYCKKIEKTDGLLNLNDSAETNVRKIRAYHLWPSAYFFTDRKGLKIRVVVKSARIENDELVLERIVPEGKREMNYKDFLRGED